MSKTKKQKVLFIGPRIQDLGGFTQNDIQKNIISSIDQVLSANKNYVVITGLNIGIETWAAIAAHKSDTPYEVYVPFANPENKWPKASQEQYQKLLSKAINTVVLDNGEFSVSKLQKKEEKMIEEADIIYSAFPDKFNKLCKYAESKDKTITFLLQNTSISSTDGQSYYIEI